MNMCSLLMHVTRTSAILEGCMYHGSVVHNSDGLYQGDFLRTELSQHEHSMLSARVQNDKDPNSRCL